jgi:Polyketide cyclase / dehydrase and lipid transport
MVDLHYSDSMIVDASPEDLYDMVSTIERMGEWSPVCTGCWWDEGESLRVGAWFTGRNETPDRTWETRSEVVAADRGRAFAFVVGGTWTKWEYTFAPSGDGALVTETWEFLPGGVARFEERFGDDAWNQIANRHASAKKGIPETLIALKRVAESN